MARKSDPFSIRLSSMTDEYVTREARRTRRSKGAVIEALAEEALRTRRFPGIAFRGEDWSRRPWVIGTGLDVWEIAAAARSYGSPEEMAKQADLAEHQVRVALAYAEAFPEEVEEAIRDADRPLEELRRQYPAFDTITAE